MEHSFISQNGRFKTLNTREFRNPEPMSDEEFKELNPVDYPTTAGRKLFVTNYGRVIVESDRGSLVLNYNNLAKKDADVTVEINKREVVLKHLVAEYFIPGYSKDNSTVSLKTPYNFDLTVTNLSLGKKSFQNTVELDDTMTRVLSKIRKWMDHQEFLVSTCMEEEIDIGTVKKALGFLYANAEYLRECGVEVKINGGK